MSSSDRGSRFGASGRDLSDRGGASRAAMGRGAAPSAGRRASARRTAAASPSPADDAWSTSPRALLRWYFVPLACVRVASAFLNIIHDCDETFNYWEPLHFLMHGFGLETWEYSSEFALRSWWYLLLHYAVAEPVRMAVDAAQRAAPALRATGATTGVLAGPASVAGGLAGPASLARDLASSLPLLPPARAVPFFAVRVALALAAAYSEARLCRAVSRRLSARVGRYALLFCVFSSGGFAASPALLPSSFAMLCLAWATACAIDGELPSAVALAAAGIVWGWSVVGVATVPLALWTLLRWRPVWAAFLHAALVLALVALPLALADAFFYGRATVSQLNFLAYNVVGGGDSALYGVEGKLYYVLNGLLGFQGGFLLFLLSLPALAIRIAAQSLRETRARARALPARGGRGDKRDSDGAAVAAAAGDRGTATSATGPGAPKAACSLCSRLCALAFLTSLPAALWFAAVSALPHKEERFLFVIYPLMAVCAGTGLALARELVVAVCRGLAAALEGRRNGVAPARWPARLAATAVALCFALQAALSLSRTAALLANYGAPMRIYAHLPRREVGAGTRGFERGEQTPAGAHGFERGEQTVATPRSTPPRTLVCLGAEWHRFPASFFLPSADYRVAFVASGFDGLLPRPFLESPNALPPRSLRDLVPATSAAPPSFNDRNRWQPEHAFANAEPCDFFVTLKESTAPGRARQGTPTPVASAHPDASAPGSSAYLDASALDAASGAWRERAAAPFVVGGGSAPASGRGSRLAGLLRALYVPGMRSRDVGINWQEYVLLERIRQANDGEAQWAELAESGKAAGSAASAASKRAEDRSPRDEL